MKPWKTISTAFALATVLVVSIGCGPNEDQLRGAVEKLLCMQLPEDANEESRKYAPGLSSNPELKLEYSIKEVSQSSEFEAEIRANLCGTAARNCGCWVDSTTFLRFLPSDSISQTGTFASADYFVEDQILEVRIIGKK